MQKLIRLLTLEPIERRLLAEALVLVVFVRLGLWTIRLRRLQPVLRRYTHIRRAGIRSIDIVRISRAVDWVSRLVPYATCLTQALATQTLLAAYGYSAHLHIGVQRDQQNAFVAHAWVECQGRVVIGGTGINLSGYTTLLSLEQH